MDFNIILNWIELELNWNWDWIQNQKQAWKQNKVESHLGSGFGSEL